MNAPRLQQIEKLFESALGVAPGMRDVFLKSHCGEDAALLREVRSLLECHEGSTTFLETPAIDLNTVFPAAVAAQTDRADPLIGEQVASYRIVQRIGTGGMGVVYLAEQRQPKRTVALKLIRPGLASPGVLQRFDHESVALGRLKHVGIAAIYEAGTAQTPLGVQPFFAMEYVAGRPLLQFATEASLTVDERLEMMAKVADAVQHAHSKGVIHRDLKPGNVLVEVPGEDSTAGPISLLLAARRSAQPKILDFGVARVSESGTTIEATGVGPSVAGERPGGGIVGTIPYMSPEQFSTAGDEAADTRTDVYALGVIMYELLTGRLPFEVRGVTLGEAAKMICAGVAPRASSIASGVSDDADAILEKAMERDPSRRYQTASALADDIRRLLANQPVLAKPASAGYQFRKLVARHKVPSALIAAILVLLIGFGVWMSVLLARTERLRVIAQAEAERANTEMKEKESQRALAERREVSARRVKRVLIESFRAADPMLARSRDIETRRLFAEEMLGVGAARVASTLSGEPLLQAELQSTIAQIYDNLGLYPESMELMERAIRTRRETLGARDAGVAELLHLYAQSAHSMGKVDLAIDSTREAVEILREQGKDSHPLQASLKSQLGTYLLTAGRVEEAIEWYEQSGLLTQPVRGHEHRVYAATLNGVAGVLSAQGRYLQSEVVLRKAIELAQVDAKPDEVIFGALRNNLAWVLHKQHRYDEAIEEANASLAVRVARFGREHTKTADTLHVLGIITAESGMARDGEQALRDALRIRTTKTPEAKGLIGETQCALATCLSYLRRHDEGDGLMREGIENLRSGYGIEHAETQSALHDAVRFYESWEKPGPAKEYGAMIKRVVSED